MEVNTILFRLITRVVCGLMDEGMEEEGRRTKEETNERQ